MTLPPFPVDDQTLDLITPSTEPVTPPSEKTGMKDKVTVPVVVEVTLPEVRRLNLKPDDVIVYEVDAGRLVTDADACRIKEQLKSWFPNHQHVVVVGGKLSVLNEEEQV